jgi:hypothetical protein
MREVGLTVELLETRHVRGAFKAMPVKTDRKDARGIAQLMRLGWFRPVHCKSLPAQEVRALLTARKLLQSNMRVQLRIRRLQRHFANVGVSPALRVAPFDIDRRPGGVVLKADPPERARLKPIRPALSLAGKAELGLGIAHRVGDSLLMDVEERGAFRLGRRQGPGTESALSAENVRSTNPTGGRVAWICLR